MADAAGYRLAARHLLVGQHDAAAVQAQQLAHQVQHLAQHRLAVDAAAHTAHHLAEQQHLLGAPVHALFARGGGGSVAGGGGHGAGAGSKNPAIRCHPQPL
jgi:hypothetical protein